MEHARTTRLATDVLVLGACASLVLVAHAVIGNGYGFHRDELQFLDDARHLDFGFVAYPPLTSFAGRVAIALFGISPQVFRLPAAVVNALSLVLVGLLARELGGRRFAQVLALAAGLPVALAFSSVLQYNTFDYLAWVLVALCTARLLRTGDERWWLGVGAAAGLGILSKYSIAFPVVSLLAGVALLPAQRHHLRSRWLWLGAAVAVAIASPNLVWLARHHGITLAMESSIHARDVAQGRAAGYFTDQVKFTLGGLPLAIAGLVALVRDGRFRLLAALWVGPFVLLALAHGRGYYLLPGYPALYAAGAVALERAMRGRGRLVRGFAVGLCGAGVAVGVAAIAWAFLPVWPVGSPAWSWQMKNNSDMGDEVGWPEFAAQVAEVRDGLAPGERERLAILTGNYGEAGALALYGPALGLPTPIAGTNSFYDRGFGPYEPETVIAAGFDLPWLDEHFRDCVDAHHVVIPYGVRNEEARRHPELFVCHGPRTGWDAFWRGFRRFG